MPWTTRNLRQFAVYWSPGLADDYGRPSFDAPIELRCRWEAKAVQYIRHDGRESVSKAVIFVPQDLVTGGVLWLGRLADLISDQDPFANDGAHEIMSFDNIPNLRGNRSVKKAIV